MPWREATEPVRMQRVALVCPADAIRELLVRVADAGSVEIDRVTGPGQTTDRTTGEAGGRLQRLRPEPVPAALLAAAPPDLDVLERDGRADLLAGEAELESYAAEAVVRGELAALAGWMPAGEIARLAAGIDGAGGGVVPLPTPRGVDPPTLLRPGGTVRQSFAPLVRTYGTVPYEDVDPTFLAGLAYVFMFGMMFGDAGHGALLVVAGLLLRRGVPRRLRALQRVWPFVVGAGGFAIVFGLLFGEFFGPTGVVPVLWLAPLDEPVTLLAAALGVGAVLLAGAYVVGGVNRWREGGWPLALSAPSGIAGAALFAGLGFVLLGADLGSPWLVTAGVVVAAAGVVLVYLGLLAASGGGATGVTQATVELFDAVIRLGTNIVSFARLAAFGLTHAALGAIVWDGTASLWGSGGLLVPAALVVFLAGNAVAFGLEALVAGVQALRLEYYELFSRVFTAEGRPFRPWHVPAEPVPAATTRSVP